MFTTIKNSFLSVGTFGLVSLGSLVYAPASQAADIDLSSWEQAGDVITNSSNARLTNAKESGIDDTNPDIFQNGVLPGNMHISTKPYSDPYLSGNTSGSLEAFLGLPSGVKLPANGSTGGAIEGSAIKGTINANQGEVFKFNYTFYSNEPLTNEPSKDYAFITINGTNTSLLADITNATIPDTVGTFRFKSEDKTFEYVFPTTAAYSIGLGVVDVGFDDASSSLAISNPTLQAAQDSGVQSVPEPMTIVGSIIALGGGTALRRRFGKIAK